MATYGKIIGGGFPVGAIAGNCEVMKPLITSGDAFQDLQEKVFATGTFSGNPMTTTVGSAVLEHLRDNPEIYKHIEGLADRIKKEMYEFAEENEFEFQLLGLGSWFIPHFVWGDIEDSRALRGLDNLMKGEALGHYMRYHGVYMPDLHTVFICSEHTDEDADKIIEAFKKSLLDMKEDGML
jgi:glutamate-1-semialdehyde 2,1-aminomutase